MLIDDTLFTYVCVCYCFLRTKYIARTEAMVLLNIHEPLDIISPASGKSVSVTDCLLHHYRDWGVDPGPPPVHVQDRRMHRYADTIARNTDLVHRWMFSASEKG